MPPGPLHCLFSRSVCNRIRTLLVRLLTPSVATSKRNRLKLNQIYLLSAACVDTTRPPPADDLEPSGTNLPP